MLLTYCPSLCQCDCVCCVLVLVYGVVYNSIHTLYIFSCLTTMYSCTVWVGWHGGGGGGGLLSTLLVWISLVVLASESPHVCTVWIWRCERPRFCVPKFLCTIYKFPFIHFIHSSQESKGHYTICNICSQSAVVLQNSSTLKRHSNTVIV